MTNEKTDEMKSSMALWTFKFLSKPLALLAFMVYLSSCGPVTEGKNRSVAQASDTLVTATKVEIMKENVDTSSYVTAVEQYVDSLNKNLSKLSLSEVDVFDESTEGGQISIYSNAADTPKLKAVYYGETGKKEYDLYFKGNQLVAFRETTFYYPSPISEKPVKIDSTIRETFILHKNIVILARKGKKLIDESDYSQKTFDINAVYSDMMKQLKD